MASLQVISSKPCNFDYTIMTFTRRNPGLLSDFNPESHAHKRHAPSLPRNVMSLHAQHKNCPSYIHDRRIVVAQISQLVSSAVSKTSRVHDATQYRRSDGGNCTQITKISYAQNGIFLSKYRILRHCKITNVSPKNLRKEAL